MQRTFEYYLETIKLRYINHLSDKSDVHFDKDYTIFTGMLRDIHEIRIQGFPINKLWKTDSSELRILIESEEVLLQHDK
jgi:hypothetical protein